MARGTMVLPNGKEVRGERAKNELEEKKYLDGFGFKLHGTYNRALENVITHHEVKDALRELGL